MTRAAAATVYLASVVTILAAAVCSAAAAPSPLGQYDASELEEVADYAPRGKRVMLPLSKFAFLPEKIQIGLDQRANRNARGKRVMLPLSKFAFLPEKIQIDVAKGAAQRRSSKRNPSYSDDSERVQDIMRQLNDSQWSQWLRHNTARGF